MAILGGGVGGLSAAHELADRGFEVTVYEARPDFGGKARSMPVPDSGTGGRPDLPGEHGFRFFPGFYRHVTDTMKRIPYRTGTVYDNLTECTEMLMAQQATKGSGVEITMPTGPPDSLEDVLNTLRGLREIVFNAGIPVSEYALFVRKLIAMMTSCDERRLGEFEEISWLEYVEADEASPPKSDAYVKFLAKGMTRTLVAAKAEEMSARTGGTVLSQLIYDMLRLDGRLDNVLNGPTSEVWIEPWLDYLRGKGVTLRPCCKVGGIHFDGHDITSVTITVGFGDDAVDETIDADYYIAALPVERFRDLVTTEMRARDPSLRHLHELKTDWMTGVMFYLAEDVPLEHGHAIFIDSEWSLTAISQKQFWPDVDLGERGEGNVGGILSVDVSAWDEPGPITGKSGMACTRKEVFREVWAQLVAHIETLDESNVVDRFLDPAIEFPNPGPNTNAEPLLINTAGSWKHRPKATTAIPNLFLASDFVQTHTDLATMEGANEAARAAVNAILKCSHSTADPCGVYELREPWFFWPYRQLDRILYRLGQKPPAPFRVTEEGDVLPVGVPGVASRFAVRHLDKLAGVDTFLAEK